MNGQAIYIQKYLNDLFNGGNDGIEVVPLNSYDLFYVANSGLGYTEVYLSNSPATDNYVANKTYYENLDDFTIRVPAALTVDDESINAAVRRYAFAPFKWNIIKY